MTLFQAAGRQFAASMLLLVGSSTISFAQCHFWQGALPQDITTLSIKSRLGDAQAQFLLGVAYLQGLGVEQNQTLGLDSLRRSAAQGVAAADRALSAAYSGGCGVGKDDAEAWRFLLKAAQDGSGTAQWEVGNHYKANGDCSEAAKWYEKAAVAGRPEAQESLGSLYEEGCGVPRDYKKAAELYRRATNPYWLDGRNALGMLYLDGHGVPQDYIEAYKWFALAGAKGNLEIAASEMTPTQIAEAQRRARKWIRDRKQDQLTEETKSKTSPLR